MLKLLPNFLSKEDFKIIQSFFLNKLDWKFNDTIAGENSNLDNFQFVHNFFNIRDPYLERGLSPHCHILKPLLLKLAPFNLLRVKANLRTRTAVPIQSNMHTDLDLKQKTAIYYLNTNNGYTLFKDGTKIDSIENNLIIFDGYREHCGVSCTDQKRRIVLNINYIPGITQDGSEYIPH
tara:strand:+ start:370 stop:903 length:534 start_codon:yes stop_codon:yes gene_type:complete